ncbi:MAG: hypothetical protein II939_09475, partial [Bacteroidales bacterium]|nr:hypothetical protein [Bacteroidales bacterium]
MKKLNIILITFCLSLLYIGCRTTKDAEKHISAIAAGTTQLAQIYNPTSTTIHPKVFVKKNDTTNIDLFVIINDSELLFSKANSQNQQLAKLKVFYKIMESYENAQMIDTSMKIVTVSKSASPKTLAIKIKLKHVDLPKFVVQTTVTDLLRGKMNISFNEVDKMDSTGIDNFNVFYTTDGLPLQKNYADIGTQLTVRYNNTP